MIENPTALRLMVFAGGVTSTHDLPASGTVTLGRANDNAVCIDDPSVSRHHAVLHLGAEVLLEDLGSANGTSLRAPIQDAATADLSQSKLAPGRRVAIAPGASFHLGSTVLVLRREARSGASPEPVIGDEAMRRLHAMIARVADGTISVLLLGETGAARRCWPTRSTSGPRARRGPSWRCTARRSPGACWRASSSVTRRAPSPAR
jgi:two-component system response regulator AtoC